VQKGVLDGHARVLRRVGIRLRQLHYFTNPAEAANMNGGKLSAWPQLTHELELGRPFFPDRKPRPATFPSQPLIEIVHHVVQVYGRRPGMKSCQA
jgi:hypothetical protein